VGQLAELELRAWRRASWILGGHKLVCLLVVLEALLSYFATWPSRRSTVFICDRRSGSSVAGVLFAAEDGTLTGVEGRCDMARGFLASFDAGAGRDDFQRLWLLGSWSRGRVYGCLIFLVFLVLVCACVVSCRFRLDQDARPEEGVM
jgi:hypothetical protein